MARREIQTTLRFVSRRGIEYTYEIPTYNINLLHIWTDEDYDIARDERGRLILIKTIKKKETEEVLVVPKGTFSRREIIRMMRRHEVPPEMLDRWIKAGLIKVRRIYVPRYRWVFRRGRPVRVLEMREVERYEAVRDIYQIKEVEIEEEDIIPVIEISFHVYPTGEYPGSSKNHPRKIVLRTEVVFLLGARPPHGKTIEDVLEKIDWDWIESDLRDYAKIVLKENSYPGANYDHPNWTWYIADETGSEVSFREVGEALIGKRMEVGE